VNADSQLSRKPELCYVGGISEIRGIEIMVDALENLDTVLHLAGEFESSELENLIKAKPGWKKVKYYGTVGREQLNQIYRTCTIGLVVLTPTPNHVNSLPIKMFEYMEAGLAVIASDFPLWKTIIEDNKAGICVSWSDKESLVSAINLILGNGILASEMGNTGRRLVLDKYNWRSEEVKLVQIYSDLLEL
jgi:glycosyltransferase involved in cell wall biosynthesis